MIKSKLSILMGMHKMTMNEVADKAGLNRNTVSSIYHGNFNRFDVTTIDKLCKLFKCKIEDLFEYIDDL